MMTEGRRPPAAGGPSQERRSMGRISVGAVRDISSCPPAFGDGKRSFFIGLKTSSMMNKPLIINEGGLMKKKQIVEVPGKGKNKIMKGILENSGETIKNQFEKEAGNITIPVIKSMASVVMKESESIMISNNFQKNSNALKEIIDIAEEGISKDNKTPSTEREKVRSCSSGELGKCEEMFEVMPQRSSSANNQNAWNRNKNIKVVDLDYGDCYSEDGSTVKLHKEKVCVLGEVCITSFEIEAEE
ncbi:hypothetical protein MA16_Dca024661 [Dendrobium catenatum]|uniref:Uncharacterized protein n=1 Tax=Dendrobium catenatum TaxID=906689 RepID=A0A2I0WG14_9ASPA|nr:hypothetical protein MA16_Dca024661 [Dendrobium catenatum]